MIGRKILSREQWRSARAGNYCPSLALTATVPTASWLLLPGSSFTVPKTACFSDAGIL